MLILKMLYKDSSEGAYAEAPLCPTCDGDFPTKKGMCDVFEIIAKTIGHTGSKPTGHMPRVSGSIRLARAGIEIWRIQIGTCGTPR